MKMDSSMAEVFDEIPEAVDHFDEYGFAVFKDGQRNSDDRHHNYKQFKLSDHQFTAWQDMLTNWSHTQLHAPERLRAYLKKGLPAHLRPQLWKNILGCHQLQQASTFNYKEFVGILRLQLADLHISEYTLKEAHHEMWSENAKTPDEEAQQQMGRKVLHLHTLRQIIVDVERTFATHRLFMDGCSEAVEGRAALFRVLGVYAHYNPEVGYCQGMSYLAGMLMMHMEDEEEVFWSMVALFEKPKYLTGYFDDSLSKIQEHALVFQKLLHNRMRNLDKHLKSLECNPLVFVTPWFMCLYTSFPCWDTVLAIWDLILLDGISTIFRVALAVLYLGQKELLDTDLSSLLPQLLHPPLKCIEYDSLMPMIWKVSVEKWEIKSLQHIVTEEKLKKLGIKRSRSKNEIVTTAIQPIKRTRLGSDRNNNDSDEVDSDTASTSASSSIFKRVMNMFTPQSQNVLQETTNNDQLGQSPDHQGHKVIDDVKGCKDKDDVKCHKVTDQLKENRARSSRLRSQGPGGAKPFILTSVEKETSEVSSKDTDSGNENLWSLVGGSGMYSPSHEVIGHPFEMHWSEESAQYEPIVKFTKLGVPSSSADGDRVSPSVPADECRNKKGKQRLKRFTYPDTDFMEEKEQDTSSSSGQGQRSKVKRKSTHGQGAKVNAKSPHVANIYWRRKLAGCGNPLNVPTNRRLIGESARLQHSFKTFHTPAPLRRSQRLRLSSSPCLLSPEVELQFFGKDVKMQDLNTTDSKGTM